jgi:parallel beta-helix repeat protein
MQFQHSIGEKAAKPGAQSRGNLEADARARVNALLRLPDRVPSRQQAFGNVSLAQPARVLAPRHAVRKRLAVAVAATALYWAATALPIQASDERAGVQIRVGMEDGDIRGSDNRVLQAAVDYVAGLGGGTVYIGEGRYQMRNALALRDHIHLVGVPGKTILAACVGFSSPLAADGDCNQRKITIKEPAGFRVGDGVSILDKNSSGGFYVTTATLTGKNGTDVFRISRPLYADYLASKQATVRLAFPVVGGWQVKHASMSGLVIEGAGKNAQPLDGCRGGGIYLFESADVAIRDCTVRNYNGDGISFQVSQDILVENCRTENNAGHGLHPGSGSQHPIVKHNKSTGNGRDGLYVCWRVRNGLFEDNTLTGNQSCGVSIGHKDSDNLFLSNQVIGNSRAGITFRNESEAMGAHRNRFEKNLILDNGTTQAGMGVAIHGEHHDLIFKQNVIGNSKPREGPSTGIQTTEAAKGLDAGANEFRNVKAKIAVMNKKDE